MKFKDEKEWMLQAEYDLKAAGITYNGGLYPYTIFLCHLAIEKALKAVFAGKMSKEPPKIHDLVALGKIVNLELPDELAGFFTTFSTVSVRARYPEDLKSSLREFDKAKTKQALNDTRKVVAWLKKQLPQK